MKMIRSAKVPPVFATTIVRHKPAINRNIDDDNWCIKNSNKYARKNLPSLQAKFAS
jgi:hypothetical protein